MKSIKMTLIAITSLFLFQACDDDDDKVEEPVVVTIVDAAVADGRFTTLVAALGATGLDATLADTASTFTVFAPTDDAFALLGQDTIDALLADTDTLSNILTYHVISSEVDAAAAISAAGTIVEMVNGDFVGLSLDGDSLLVNTSTVIITDLQTDNGIIHVIDAVLIPPTAKGEPTMNIVETAVAAGNFTTLVAALQATDLDVALADADAIFTVFAPTDDAFALIGEETIATLLANTDVLSEILLQHVVEGEVSSVTAFTLNGVSAETLSTNLIPIAINSATDSLTFGGANIVVKDIYTTNGVIHVIDMVVVGDVEVPAPNMSIVDVAVENGNFTTLVAALQATGLDSVLADLDTDFTVFAPTDAAFALLGDEAIAALLNDAEALSNILLYHVVSGAAVLQDAAVAKAQSDDKMVSMANEQMASLSLSGSTLYINKSAVSAANVMADNGVIHVVDQVILPPTAKDEPTMSIVDVAVANPDFSTLVAALTAADLVSTLADENATFTVFAPTNAAFAKIDATVLSGLLAATDALSSVLLKHVIGGAEINSLGAYAANGAMVETAGGDNVSISLVNFTQVSNGETDEVAYDASNEMLVGGMNSSQNGFTVYVFDNDLGTSGSECNDACATNWPPVLVTDAEVDNIPGLSMVERDDGSMQASYLGRPLYFFAGDSAAGDMMGQGLSDVWWTVKQEQVSLQVQGSNVTTTDIYTTNGVIHVIDTVITN
ncbi:fasciclin domain-containing protein [uncultured Paraglaciecola sp.]|uniref:fasciclin domain-containing protein n=1 Tax=uncultured Paraglaciecola sp. TaxID=1765024 RepID=UPI0025EDAB52|nr:fasciclin domain-containing protein [uncultured Paraglaciecola sp.]